MITNQNAAVLDVGFEVPGPDVRDVRDEFKDQARDHCNDIIISHGDVLPRDDTNC